MIQIMIHRVMKMIQMMKKEKKIQMMITERTKMILMITRNRIFNKMMISICIMKKRQVMMITKKNEGVDNLD